MTHQFLRHHFITTNRLMNSKAFVQGFNDVRKKKTFLYDKYDTDADAWAYERGRQFALSYIGPLKIGRGVSVTAEAVMNRLLRSGLIP
jgi:hypothetical protein